MDAVSKTDQVGTGKVTYAVNANGEKTIELKYPDYANSAGEVAQGAGVISYNPVPATSAADIGAKLDEAIGSQTDKLATKQEQIKVSEAYLAEITAAKAAGNNISDSKFTQARYAIENAKRQAAIAETNIKFLQDAKVSVSQSFDSSYTSLQEQQAATAQAEVKPAPVATPETTAVTDAKTETAEAAVATEAAPQAGPVTETEKHNIVANDSVAPTEVVQDTPPNNISKEPPPEESRRQITDYQAKAPSDSNTVTGNFGSLVNPYATPSSIVGNRLHQYATYTYSITLHMLEQDSFNVMADGGEWIGLPSTHTLISSAGRWGDLVKDKLNFQRPPEFADDFYFDGFSMETIIGLNQQGRGTNVIDVNFTLIEPYGLTFMNRLIAMSLRLKIPNYLANPYVLQIDFFGSDELGMEVNPIPNITKFIPIKLIECKIKVGTSGATYTCRATPYNHSAWSQTLASTPVNFEITAKQVGDFFNNTGDVSNIIAQAKVRSVATKEREAVAQSAEATQAEIDNRTKLLTDKINAPFTVKSYTGAYNAYQLFLKDNKSIQHESVLIFKIDPAIAKSDVVYPKQSDVKTVAMEDRNKPAPPSSHVSKTTPSTAPPQTGPKTSVNVFNINAGTSVVEVINMVMRNSTYITSQIKDTNKTADQLLEEGKTLNWFKIVPKIKLRNYDFVTNTWSHEITISVIPFKHHNYKHPMTAKSNKEEIQKGLRKEYNYMYTGKNDDVLDFSIDFDALFYTAVNVLTENLASLSGADKRVSGDPTADPIALDIATAHLKAAAIQFNIIKPISGEATPMGNWQNASVAIAADIMKSVYSGARGDMINLQVRIIGDPDFIKQDDLYLNPSNPNYPDEGALFAKDGSILTDRGDIFCKITFKTPVDIDQSTGGLRRDEYLESNFSGYYKIIKVTNELRGGKFEQVLNMIRWPEDIVTPAKSNSIDQRVATGDQANARTAEAADAARRANNTAILTKVVNNANGAATDSARKTDSLAVASRAARKKYAASNEKTQSKPTTSALPASVPARPTGFAATYAARTAWDKQYSANYNPNGTLKTAGSPAVDPKLKKVAEAGDTKSIEDAFASSGGA